MVTSSEESRMFYYRVSEASPEFTVTALGAGGPTRFVSSESDGFLRARAAI